MENQRINVTVENGVKELVFREGVAPAVIEPRMLGIRGIITVPLTFLEKRHETIDFNTSHIIVDREKYEIKLILNEDTELKSIVCGCLDFTEEFNSFGINTGKVWTPKNLGAFIKMNRVCFESKDVANKLVSSLMSVTIKVDKVVESHNGTRAETRQLKEQTLKECNIPESLVLAIPIFKGSDKVVFSCEIYIDPDDLSIQLISPEAADFIKEVRDSEIDKVLMSIKDECPDIAILEV